MKEPMKKLLVLSFYKDKNETTQKLQNLGVVHPEVDNLFSSSDLETIATRKSSIKKTIDYLETITSIEDPSINGFNDNSLEDVANNVQSIRETIERIKKKRKSLEKDLIRAEPWGNFDKEKTETLIKKGISFKYYLAKKRRFRRFDFSGVNYYLIQENNDKVYFVVISDKEEEINIPFNQVKLSKLIPAEISQNLNQLSSEEDKLKKDLQKLTSFLPKLKNDVLVSENLLEFKKVHGSYSSAHDGKIMGITGWFPKKTEKDLVKSLKDQNIAFIISEPSITDKVPIQLQNNRYSKIFEPVTRIFQLPNYHEFDLTPLIAVFYPIFFAYCLGDAGYGLVLVVLSIVGALTFLKTNKNIAIFGLLLGAFTMVMGIVKSGSVFGIPISNASDVPLFQFLAQYILIPDDQSFVFNAFNVALMIGVVQILVGVITSIFKGIVFQSFTHALSQVGKFMIISGILIVFLTDMQNVEELKPYAPAAKIVLLFGIGLVLFFHNLQHSLLKRMGSGLLPLFFIFTGIMGDVLSYVRLFALGVVSSVLGLVVNQIGMQIMSSGWWGIIIGIIFLLLGHSLNMALAFLGAVVHPLRLTFVEFYNNAQFEGGGIEYKPFKNVTNNN